MKKNKKVCPFCGSEDLCCFDVYTYKRYFMLDDDNFCTGKIIGSSGGVPDGQGFRYQCNDCCKIFN